MYLLRGYLVVAVLLLLVKTIQLGCTSSRPSGMGIYPWPSFEGPMALRAMPGAGVRRRRPKPAGARDVDSSSTGNRRGEGRATTRLLPLQAGERTCRLHLIDRRCTETR